MSFLASIAHRLHTFLFVVVLACGIVTAQEVAIWSDRTGKFQVEAKFLGIEESEVKLKKADGKVISVSISRLSESSRQTAKELSEALDDAHLNKLKINRLGSIGLERDVPAVTDPDKKDVKPRYERWKINFVVKDENEYGRLLDAFHLELAAMGGGILGIDYAKNFSSEQPTAWNGNPRLEKRIYFLNTKSNPMVNWQRKLLEQARVVTAGRMTLLLVTSNIENRMAILESEYCKKNGSIPISSVEESTFAFVIVNQTPLIVLTGLKRKKQ